MIKHILTTITVLIAITLTIALLGFDGEPKKVNIQAQEKYPQCQEQCQSDNEYANYLCTISCSEFTSEDQ